MFKVADMLLNALCWANRLATMNWGDLLSGEDAGVHRGEHLPAVAVAIGDLISHHDHEGDDLSLAGGGCWKRSRATCCHGSGVHAGEAVSDHEVGERSGVGEHAGRHQREHGAGVAELLGHQEGGDLLLVFAVMMHKGSPPVFKKRPPVWRSLYRVKRSLM